MILRRTLICICVFIMLFNSCAVHKKVFKQGEIAFNKQDWDRAVKNLLEAVEKKPDNVEYRISLGRALIAASNSHLRRGGNFFKDRELKLALLEFDKSLEFNPENNEARRQKRLVLKNMEEIKKKYREKTDIERLKEEAEKKELVDFKKELNEKKFDFRVVNQNLKNIFKALRNVSGVNFLFDEAFKSKKMSIRLENTTLLEVIETIVRQSKLFYKIIDTKTIVVIPDTPAKRRQYEEQVMKTFFLSNGESEDIRKIVSSLTGIKSIAVNKSLNSITVTAIPEKLKLAEKIIQTHDKPKGELIIEIEIIEVNKKTIREYGIELSQYEVGEVYSPGPPTEGGASAIRLNNLRYTDASDFLLTLPSLNYKLLRFNSRSKIKARPRLRVLEQEKVKVRLGDKVPIPTTTFMSRYGGSSNTAGNDLPVTSYQMQDIGINIDITPRIHHDGLVTIKMKFELTFITDPGTPTLPPTIGNRSVDTLLRLRDNETGILAGLLRDTERKSQRGLPFISSIPVLKQIFSGNKKEIEQTDIVVTVTPRIVRFPEINREDLDYLWVGTKDRPGLKEKPPFSTKEVPRREEPIKKEKATGKKKPRPEVTGTKGAEVNKKEEAKGTGKNIQADAVVQEGPLISFEAPVGEVEQGGIFPTKLVLDKSTGVKFIKCEIAFDPRIFQVTGIERGELLKKEQGQGQFFKTFDNRNGKIRLNITLDEKQSESGVREIAILNFKASGSGRSDLKPVLFEVLDKNMKKIESKFSKITFEVKR